MSLLNARRVEYVLLPDKQWHQVAWEPEDPDDDEDGEPNETSTFHYDDSGFFFLEADYNRVPVIGPVSSVLAVKYRD